MPDPTKSQTDRSTYRDKARNLVDELTPEQLRSSAEGWHEIAFMVEAGATDEEIVTVARATVYRDAYS